MPPGGEYGGEKFRCRRQPFADRFLEQIELAEQGLVPWTDFVWTGCTQCVAGETLIFDPSTGRETPIRELAEAGKSITVATRFGQQRCAAPFLKGRDRLYRVTTKSGRSFVATAKHRVMTDDGWLCVERLVPFSSRLRPALPRILPESTWGTDPSALQQGALDLMRTIRDSQSGCHPFCHSCGEQPRDDQGCGRCAVPLRADAVERNLGSSRADGPGTFPKRSPIYRPSFHLSTTGDGPSLVQQKQETESLSAECMRPIAADWFQFFEQSHSVKCRQPAVPAQGHRSSRLLQSAASHAHPFDENEHWPDCTIAGDTVASIEYVRTDNFYDMQVPGAGHYFAEGFWHHNSGKTTLGLIVLMYVVFELKEQIIFGIPTMVLAKKKWKKDIRPMIAASQYGRYLPTRGPSSQGGSTIDELYFKHGPSLTFMSAAGGREQRSSDTARWILVTEADSFSELDEAGGEGRKIDQLFARTHAFGDRRRALAECTVTTDDAFVWDTYDKKSSRSELVCQCEACLQWVRLERQHLSGWQDGKSQLDAGRLARWECPNPECGHLFDDVERKHMVAGSKLRHVGQVILPDGTITGPVPETRTLGFRWNAFDNILAWKSAFIAENEYAAAKSKTPEQSGVAIGQFWWAQPREADAVDLLSLDPQKIQDRVISFTKDLIPADAELVVLGGDMGKRNLHWVLIAIRPGNRIHVCSYGMVPVPYEQMQLNLALQSAMMSLRERVNRGWPVEGRAVDDVMVPGQVFMDSGWGDYADLVYGMCAEFGVRWKAIKGYGFGQGAGFSSTSYHAPSGTGATVKLIGSGWHLVELDSQGFQLIHIDANYWKSRLQTAIVSDADSPGSVTLFDGTTNEHNEYTQHLCSERARIKSKWIAGHLDQREVWERVHKKNHYLDATCYGLAAADFLRFLRDLPKEGTPAASNDRTPVIVRPDGRPFVVNGGRT